MDNSSGSSDLNISPILASGLVINVVFSIPPSIKNGLLIIFATYPVNIVERPYCLIPAYL